MFKEKYKNDNERIQPSEAQLEKLANNMYKYSKSQKNGMKINFNIFSFNKRLKLAGFLSVAGIILITSYVLIGKPFTKEMVYENESASIADSAAEHNSIDGLKGQENPQYPDKSAENPESGLGDDLVMESEDETKSHEVRSAKYQTYERWFENENQYIDLKINETLYTFIYKFYDLPIQVIPDSDKIKSEESWVGQYVIYIEFSSNTNLELIIYSNGYVEDLNTNNYYLFEESDLENFLSEIR